MSELFLALLGSAGSLFIAVGFAAGLFLVVWLPYMAWSVTRNIRQIRVQLERLNDTLERSSSPSRPGTLGI
jgi:hypothetical protein